MRFGHLDNAYNASHEPIKGFDRNRLNGVEKFNKDEHYLYLKQHNTFAAPKMFSPYLGADGRHMPIGQPGYEHIAKLHRNASSIPAANRDHISVRIRRISIAAAIGVSVVFAVASSIGVYW
ncbi:hypothetical protein BgAZ_403160 [Babesia gibsoni]|uniref:Uncharacterized protein n=1 Tax=Babesia gibsoni TaxID=33632 RepID=A0AAD8LP23_BABGI|nr:hypothetical protein BgAZ_403160 [Babesia gibsoni]